MNLFAGGKFEASLLRSSLLRCKSLPARRSSVRSSTNRRRIDSDLLRFLGFRSIQAHFRVPVVLLFRSLLMDGTRDSSPESTALDGEGFVHVSEAERLTEDTGSEAGISREAWLEPAVWPGEDSARVFGEEFECSVVDSEEPKKILPEELAKGVVVLECESTAGGGSCDVYLIGTAHVSQESCREVQAVISYLKPQVVFLELCTSRVAVLTPQDLKVPTMNEMVDMWRKRDSNIFGILYSYFLAKVASKLEVLPGAEFRVAFEEARNFGAKVVLGDRPVQITLRRTWGKMTLWHKAKFLSHIIFQSLFLPSSDDLNKLLKDLDDGDLLTVLIQEMGKAFPTLIETLLVERDMYMSSKLFRVASEHSSVVAVVGRGHLAGIKKYWKQPLKIDHLLEDPRKSSYATPAKILASLGVAATGAAIISGIYFACRR
ncbi:traB family protein isoform X2 [Wolffia australiana]